MTSGEGLIEIHDLCAVEDLSDPGSRGFALDLGGERPLRCFVIRKGQVLRAYRNSCPHTGAPLEWLPDQFLDMDGGFVQCAIHGALFRPEDGYCVRGPCIGQSLVGLRLRLDADRVQLCLSSADLSDCRIGVADPG